MFEKRPIWGLIVGLNVCVLVWLISVQEPVVFDVNTIALSSSSSSSSSGSGSSTYNYITNTNTAAGQEAAPPVAAALQQAQQQASYGRGRDLLSNRKSNEYDDNLPAASASTSTTLNLSNNSNNNINKSTKNSSKQATIAHNFEESMKTTTKVSDLFTNIQKLTSSPGTGILDAQPQPTPSWAKLIAAASALPAEDFSQLIDLKNFRFLLPQPVCGSHIEALILVHSAPRNHEKRQVIRETWASISHHTTASPLRVLFLLGAVNSEELQNDLVNENNNYRDIVQGSFVDDYRNMTYKHVTAFKWFLYNCPHAQILIKVDDDVYVNTPQLIKYLKDQQHSVTQNVKNDITNNNPTIATSVATMMTPNKTTTSNTNTNTTPTTNSSSTLTNFFSIFNNFAMAPSPQPPAAVASSWASFNASRKLFNHPQNLLFCQKIIGSLVKRSYRSKWRVSFKDYSQRYYPPYCPGYAIIYSPDVVYRLYTAAQSSKYFWIDDVHITGVLAQQTNTTITTSSHYVLFSDVCDQILTGKTDLSETEFLFAWHSISAQKIKLLWYLQMMSLQTPDQLHYKKHNTMNDVANDMWSHRQRHDNQKRRTKNDGVYSSSYTYTSANGFR